MKPNTNRTFMQKIRDFIEDGVFAFAMNYAGRKSDYDTVRRFENRIR